MPGYFCHAHHHIFQCLRQQEDQDVERGRALTLSTSLRAVECVEKSSTEVARREFRADAEEILSVVQPEAMTFLLSFLCGRPRCHVQVVID